MSLPGYACSASFLSSVYLYFVSLSLVHVSVFVSLHRVRVSHFDLLVPAYSVTEERQQLVISCILSDTSAMTA